MLYNAGKQRLLDQCKLNDANSIDGAIIQKRSLIQINTRTISSSSVHLYDKLDDISFVT